MNFNRYLEVLGNFIQKGFKIILNANDFYGKSLLEYLFDIVHFLQYKGLSE